jgi:hypothetical protein
MTCKGVALLFLTTLATSQPVGLSRSDRAALATLRRVIPRLEGHEISRKQFERLLPRSGLPTWQRLQLTAVAFEDSRPEKNRRC